MNFQFEHNGQVYAVRVERSQGGMLLTIDGQQRAVEVLDSQPGRTSLRLLDGEQAGQALTIEWADSGSELWLALDGCTYRLERPKPRARHAGSAGVDGAESVRAPMPAQVRAVQVEVGELVEKGQALLLLEAMKMEIRIKAPSAGRVTRVLVSAGQAVDKEQILVEIAAEHTAAIST
jgi:3-methylcrotonyl-CoA carboxylase alpha subunit